MNKKYQRKKLLLKIKYMLLLTCTGFCTSYKEGFGQKKKIEINNILKNTEIKLLTVINNLLGKTI